MIGEYGRHMESVTEVPEEANGLRKPQFLRAKAYML